MRSHSRNFLPALNGNGIVNLPVPLIRFFLFALLLAVCACKGPESDNRFPSGPLGAQESLALIEQYGEKLMILDVRTDAEFNDGHVPGALHIPVASLEERMREVPHGPVLILCRGGNRAAKAYSMIKEARPARQNLWYLKGKPEYRQSDFTFHD
jgi:rhodanese-related sulfurtransferase